jgi:molybdopterin-synthase adenylyltransferase
MSTATLTSPDLSERDLRQRDLVPPEKLSQVHALVIGVGAVGRQVAWQLAATGVEAMTLVDHDVVDVVNLAPQAYLPADLGQKKVEATAAFCQALSPALRIETVAERFRRSSVRTLACFEPMDRQLAVFCCVDSIATRGVVWESVRGRACFFADARMSAEVVRVLASSDPAADTYYPTTLFAAAEAFTGPCTARSTLYTATIAAGLMLSQFTRWLRGLPVERDVLLNLLAAELTTE